MSSRITVTGELELQAKLHQVARDISHGDFVEEMGQVVLYVAGDARKNVPVDTGRLKNSIVSDVTVSKGEIQGVVGSNVEYAADVEEGTPPHTVPAGSLDVWARRHGTIGIIVARSIAKRGTRAHKYLERAFESNREMIKTRLGNVVSRIVRK